MIPLLLSGAWLAQPWVMAIVGAAALVIVAVGLVARTRRPDHGVPLAHLERVRQLPRYRHLAARARRRRLIEAVAMLLVTASLVVLTGRPVTSDPRTHGRSTRDVILCLDVSGSMSKVDDAIVSAYIDLSRNLRGERIGFVAFDSTAVTVFPLTDDASYIAEQLEAFRNQLRHPPIAGTRTGVGGSSLIGDGLASCLDRFDRTDAARSRTVVLATDNELSGKPLFSLSDAVAKAVDRRVLIEGIVPAEASAAATSVLADQLRRTRGDVLTLHSGRPENPGRIIASIESGPAAALPARADLAQRDLVWPSAAVVVLGLAAAAWVSRREVRP